jgi:hypothetical protein
LLAHGQWFSLGTPASSTTKTGRHDIAEILLKIKSNQSNQNQNIHVSIISIVNKVCKDVICSDHFNTFYIQQSNT